MIPSNEAMRAHLAAARNEVKDLACGKRNGGRDFHISIPARDSDSDQVLCAALDDLDALLKARVENINRGVVLRVPQGVSVDVGYYNAPDA